MSCAGRRCLTNRRIPRGELARDGRGVNLA